MPLCPPPPPASPRLCLPLIGQSGISCCLSHCAADAHLDGCIPQILVLCIVPVQMEKKYPHALLRKSCLGGGAALPQEQLPQQASQLRQWSFELGGFSQRQAWFRGSLFGGFVFKLQRIAGLECLLKLLASLDLCFKVLQVLLATERSKGKRCVPGRTNPPVIQGPQAERQMGQIT